MQLLAETSAEYGRMKTKRDQPKQSGHQTRPFSLFGMCVWVCVYFFYIYIYIYIYLLRFVLLRLVFDFGEQDKEESTKKERKEWKERQ